MPQINPRGYHCDLFSASANFDSVMADFMWPIGHRVLRLNIISKGKVSGPTHLPQLSAGGVGVGWGVVSPNPFEPLRDWIEYKAEKEGIYLILVSASL